MRGNGLTWSIKPKGMWWKTYSALGKRLCEKADQLSAAKTRYILQLGARDLNKTQRGRTVSDENTAFEDELSLFQAE